MISLNCRKHSKDMALTAKIFDDGTWKLVISDFHEQNWLQRWRLIPNVVDGVSGYNLLCMGQGNAPMQPSGVGKIHLRPDIAETIANTNPDYCWVITPTNDKHHPSFFIRSFDSKKVMDVDHARCGEGTSVLLWDFNGDDNQRWLILPVSG